MEKFWKILKEVEFFNTVYGWLFYSAGVQIILSLLSGLLGVVFFNDLQIEIRIITSLIIGFCFWYPRWDKRKR